MERVVVLGRGGAGKTTLASRLSTRTGLPHVELDALFWDGALEPLTSEEWTRRQSELAGEQCWIMDGDLGPSDVLEPRLARADTVVIVATPLGRCLWRAARRGSERLDFWRWAIGWRRRSLPRLLAAIRDHAADADLVVLRSRHDLEAWMQGQG